MSLLDELKKRWNEKREEFFRVEKAQDELASELLEYEVAIAAIEADKVFAEPAAPEPETQSDDWTNGGEDHLDAACAELLADDASEFAESESVAANNQIGSVENCDIHSELAASDSTLGSSLRPFIDLHPEEGASKPHPGGVQESRDQFDDEASRAAAIELTADVEPLPQPEWNEPQPTEGYAPVVDNAEAHLQAVEAERYALATNPEADALAKAHDWYDPKAVAERNRFNPWGIFKREKEDA